VIVGHFRQNNFQYLRELADSLRSLGQPIDLAKVMEAMEEHDSHSE